MASGRVDPEEDPRSDRRGTGRMEEGPSWSSGGRGGLPETAAPRIRSEPSPHPGPATEGFPRSAKVPRQRGHESAVPGLVHRGRRVDGAAQSLPRGGDRDPVVGADSDVSPASGVPPADVCEDVLVVPGDLLPRDVADAHEGQLPPRGMGPDLIPLPEVDELDVPVVLRTIHFRVDVRTLQREAR